MTLSFGPLRCLALLSTALTVALPAGAAPSAAENRYLPADDVELGTEAARELRRQAPTLADGDVAVFIRQVGLRLVDALPETLRYQAFRFSFEIVNQPELATVGLPGGPIFISRGMIETAKSEGQVAALLAHELSHVVLRHATLQASRGQLQVGPLNAAAVGRIVGGMQGGILEDATTFSLGSYFLMYDAPHEQQAGDLTVQILTRAGYDANDFAAVVSAIFASGTGRSGPQWIADHRQQVAETVDQKSARSTGDTDDAFAIVQAKLANTPRPTRRPEDVRTSLAGRTGYGVPAPSGEYRQDVLGDRIRLRVPANWRRLPVGNTVTFAPEGAFGDTLRGPLGLTHGLQIGVARSVTGNLQLDIQTLLQRLAQTNGDVRWTPAFQSARIAGRNGLTTTLSSVSPVTGEFEHVSVAAIHLSDGSLCYVIGLAPLEDVGTYRGAFNQVVDSLRVVR
jgi:peptidase M48-like protein